ncbi:MAG TPA: AIR synthase related protein [Terriglobales bacterium]|nr:AIR synthase related protein [Terriglobales bacterium]
MIPERQWLQWVERAAGSAATRREVRLGIGDDAALLRPRRGCELAITTDLMVEGVHFLHAGARATGARLATRALSDLAAMGAEPLALFLSSAYPADLPAAWPRQLYRGLLAACGAAHAQLAGGDVSSSPGPILLDVVGVGQCPAGQALRRSGACPGDRIYVSGQLGRPQNAPRTARWQLGMALRRRATAAIDLSDGLSTDLDHLCQASQVGAEITAASIPTQNLEAALHQGEDYELLFTLPAHRRPPRGFGLTSIGVITRASGIYLLHRGACHPLAPRGWQHFARV